PSQHGAREERLRPATGVRAIEAKIGAGVECSGGSFLVSLSDSAAALDRAHREHVPSTRLSNSRHNEPWSGTPRKRSLNVAAGHAQQDCRWAALEPGTHFSRIADM